MTILPPIAPQHISIGFYIRQLLTTYRFYAIAMVLIASMGAIMGLLVDYQIKEMIDSIATNHAANLAYWVGMFVLYKFLHHVVYFVDRVLDIHYKPRIIEQTVLDVYHRTMEHSLHWFDSHLSGEISSKIADFQESIQTMISHLFAMISAVVVMLVMCFFLFTIHPLTAGVFVGFILLYTPIIYLLMKKQIGLQEISVQSRQQAIGIVNDSIVNIFATKIIGNLSTEFSLRLQPALRDWKKHLKRTLQFDAYAVDNADTIMVVLLSGLQIYVLAHLYRQGEITAGGFAFVAMMTLRIHEVLDRFLENLLMNINPSVAQIKASYALANSPVDVQDRDDAVAMLAVQGKVVYQSVGFAYGGTTRKVLDGLDLTIQPGERLGIVGTSGTGKTTLMKCLLRYFDVAEGSIYVDGHDIRSITQESLRAAISIIPQDITLFHRSVRENLQLAKYEATEAEIMAACKQANIHDDILQMPQGYDTVVGERGVKLSGGQRQRVAIARAILKNAPILILDEATSSLDTPTEQLIQASLDAMLETTPATVIAIAHRLSTLKQMDRIIVLDKGRIVEEGSHQQLLEKPGGLYKKLWEMQII